MIVELLVVAGIAIGAVAYTRQIRVTPPAPRAADWLRVAKAAGVSDVAADSDVTFGGTDGKLDVRVEVFAEQGVVAAHVAVGGLAPEIGVERGGLGSRLLGVVGVRALELGDPAFDAELVTASSAPFVARALFDVKTRARTRKAFRAGHPIGIDGGVLKATLGRASDPAVRFDAEALRALLELAHRLEPPLEPEARLARIVKDDPEARVRAGALDALIDASPRHPRTFEAVRAAVKDADHSIRLRAALVFGEEGVPTLQALAADPEGDDATGAAAVAALGARFPSTAACDAIARAAEGRRVRTGEAAIDALAAAGGPAVERALVGALDAPVEAVAEAAARALGRCGGVGAIPDLARAEERGGAIRRAAREAIAAVQSRLAGATPGQVSLAGGEAGQLSVAEEGAGRLSIEAEE